MTDAICADEAQANAAARAAMGEVAWPTIGLAAVLVFAYVGIFIGFNLDLLPLWLSTLLIALVVYATYTVLHEAVHGSISGTNKAFKRVNDALGFVAGQIIGTSFIAHRKEHLAHHIHTNIEGRDPDLPLASGKGLALVLGAIRALPHQVQYYGQTHWVRAPLRERVIVCLEIGAAVAWRMALVVWLGIVPALMVLVVANLIGIFITLILFAWIVHRPHSAVGRYRDTAAFVFPQGVDTVISGLWLFQNYHAIHHLFPRVPFYRYRQVFKQIEPVMAANGSPIYRWGRRAPHGSGALKG